MFGVGQNPGTALVRAEPCGWTHRKRLCGCSHVTNNPACELLSLFCKSPQSLPSSVTTSTSTSTLTSPSLAHISARSLPSIELCSISPPTCLANAFLHKSRVLQDAFVCPPLGGYSEGFQHLEQCPSRSPCKLSGCSALSRVQFLILPQDVSFLAQSLTNVS